MADVLRLVLSPVSQLVTFVLTRLIEPILFALVNAYDVYVYSPIAAFCTPIVERVPRWIEVGDRKVEVFTANIVTYSRTFLVVPIALALKMNAPWTAFWLVMLHDFLDHLDGIVAKAHRRMFPGLDDGALGGFMDAFCDKIVNVFALWSLLLVYDSSLLSTRQNLALVLSCGAVIAYEFAIGVVRVQDFFHQAYSPKNAEEASQRNIASNMEGKLKEKLESTGIALLCLAQKYDDSPLDHYVGVAGVVCLLLCLRLAHASLSHKLAARRERSNDTDDRNSAATVGSSTFESSTTTSTTTTPSSSSSSSPSATTPSGGSASDHDTPVKQSAAFDVSVAAQFHPEQLNRIDRAMEKLRAREQAWDAVEEGDDERDSLHPDPFGSDAEFLLSDAHRPTPVVDKIFTVGCLDLFHRGHKRLLRRLRSLGRQVIVGVHDDASIFKLKHRHPIDNVEKRLANVRPYVDQVYVIAGTDPTPFVEAMISLQPGETALYVRGADMRQFPGREMVEKRMPVRFFDYTRGVSSTMIRKTLGLQPIH